MPETRFYYSQTNRNKVYFRCTLINPYWLQKRSWLGPAVKAAAGSHFCVPFRWRCREWATSMSDVQRTFINFICCCQKPTQSFSCILIASSIDSAMWATARRWNSKNEWFLVLSWTKDKSDPMLGHTCPCSPQGFFAHPSTTAWMTQPNRFLWREIPSLHGYWPAAEQPANGTSESLLVLVLLSHAIRYSMRARRTPSSPPARTSFNWKNNRPSDCCFCGTIQWLW